MVMPRVRWESAAHQGRLRVCRRERRRAAIALLCEPAGAESAQRLEKCQQIVQGSRIESCAEFHPCAWSH